jgi:Lon protease-like protein
VDHGAGRYSLHCRTGERIRVTEWLPDDPYPRAMVTLWPDEPGDPVSQVQLLTIEDRTMALFERIAGARGVSLPDREALLGPSTAGDPGHRLFALAGRIPIGTADRYAVLSAPSAADRLAALSDAVDTVVEMVEFQLSE